jgi:hypothetical protein
VRKELVPPEQTVKEKNILRRSEAIGGKMGTASRQNSGSLVTRCSALFGFYKYGSHLRVLSNTKMI